MDTVNHTIIEFNFNKLSINSDFDVINNTVDITYRLK